MDKKNLKIALIEPVGGHGGMDYYDYGLALGLGENDIDVHYFTSTQTNIRNYKNVITYLTFRKVWDTENKITRLYFFLIGYCRAFRTAKSKDIKIVHFQFFDLSILNLVVVFLGRFFKFEMIMTLHDVSSLKGEDSSFVENCILKNFPKVIVHNKLSYSELFKKVNSNQEIQIIPHGNYLPFVEELCYEPNSNESLKLLFFGQIKEVKGLEILLKALAIAVEQNKNIHLSIAGKPWHDNLDKYQKLIISLDLETFVTKHFKYIPNDAVSGYFLEADVIVLPYKKIYQSGVLLLAMSYGRAVLTSNLEAFKEIVEDAKTGYLFEEGNAEELSKVILKIAANREELKAIKNRASHLLRTDFDWSFIGKETKKLYEKK
jgi:D-inositol-3-phosphate glycosyltransferase